ncbi:hypothetical protein RRG08_007601 [Elysia crispata]|uniref:Uncharacterized protein n=1 Tax=Elysia crispata TaxID=231223 RepID=A0AAE1DZB6_9GAST|nr:hypothetical protein RRG08_007601 [Elysia crispata]
MRSQCNIYDLINGFRRVVSGKSSAAAHLAFLAHWPHVGATSSQVKNTIPDKQQRWKKNSNLTENEINSRTVSAAEGGESVPTNASVLALLPDMERREREAVTRCPKHRPTVRKKEFITSLTTLSYTTSTPLLLFLMLINISGLATRSGLEQASRDARLWTACFNLLLYLKSRLIL